MTLHRSRLMWGAGQDWSFCCERSMTLMCFNHDPLIHSDGHWSQVPVYYSPCLSKSFHIVHSSNLLIETVLYRFKHNSYRKESLFLLLSNFWLVAFVQGLQPTKQSQHKSSSDGVLQRCWSEESSCCIARRLHEVPSCERS